MWSLYLVVCAIAVKLSNADNNLLRFKEYQFTFSVPNNKQLRSLINADTDTDTDTDADDTFSCDMIPSMLKKLCLRFTDNNDVEYKYEPGFSANINTNDDIISTNDASNWNEFNYGRKGYVKQCRYANAKRECVHYDSPSNTMTFGIKIGTNKNHKSAANTLPANIANINNNYPAENGIDINQLISSIPWNSFLPSFDNYESAHQFEYGDALGYDRWSSDAMDCILCDIMNNLDISNIFKAYGDFAYIFNEHEFDYNMDKDWTFKLANNKKCTKSIEGIKHKICAAETKDNKVLISFEKEADKNDHIRRLLNDELIQNLENEFDGVILDFDDDNVWDDVTQIQNENDDIFIRKCKAFQLAHFCATHGKNHYLKFHVKVGTHKLKRQPTKVIEKEESKIGDMFNNLFSAAGMAFYNDYDQYDYEQDLEDIVDNMQDEYDNNGNKELGDVLEEIADEIDDDVQDKIDDKYAENVANEIVNEIKNDKELDNELEEIVEEIGDENGTN